MLRAAMAIQTTRLAEYFATGVQPRPLGSAASTTVPHQAFECADSRWLAIGVVSDAQWPGFCRALKLDDLKRMGVFRGAPPQSISQLTEARFEPVRDRMAFGFAV